MRVLYDVTRETVAVVAIVTKAEAAQSLAEHGTPVRQAALTEAKDDLSRFLRLAESEELLIDCRLEHHPEFLQRVAKARDDLQSGRDVRLEDLHKRTSQVHQR